MPTRRSGLAEQVEGGPLNTQEVGGDNHSDTFDDSDFTSSPVAHDQTFQVEELTPRMQFLRVVSLQITRDELSIRNLSHEPLSHALTNSDVSESEAHDLLGSLGKDSDADFDIEPIENVTVLDIGQLLNRRRVFQIFTSRKVHILRAASAKAKRKICDTIALLADAAESPEVARSYRSVPELTVEGMKQSVEEYTALLQQYEAQVEELKVLRFKSANLSETTPDTALID
ncbi:hypothetical protein HK097_008950 [Rhizophlyctis rosea]|uniref:Uncharacterized protein n=1 Tax=Rhizophlyctis rosea TaxID=64517 RepID=A0AAD5SB84_9FUNG|nr:hypothetical protein HK097_008950 [Rhizophlyctis rosea]